MSSSTTTKDIILTHLRKEKIKLWLPPYRNLPTAGGDTNDEAIYRLAESMQQTLIPDAGSNNTHDSSSTSTLTSTSNNSVPITNIQQGTISINGRGSISLGGGKNQHDQNSSIEEIYTVLKELQSHAIQKLNEKNSIDIKILASKPHFSSLFINGTMQGDSISNNSSTVVNALLPSSWGDEVTITSSTTQNKSLHLHVTNLSPSLTVHQISDDMCRILGATCYLERKEYGM